VNPRLADDLKILQFRRAGRTLLSKHFENNGGGHNRDAQRGLETQSAMGHDVKEP
jgi:hypothetical protein